MSDIHEVDLKIEPYSEEQMTVNFEPTGMEYELLPGDFLTVTIRGPGTGLVEIGYAFPNTVIVGAWAGAETLVWGSDGRELHA